MTKKKDKLEKKFPDSKFPPKGIKTTGKYKGRSNKLGGGGRFKQMVDKVGSPALAAWIGRKTLGKKKFQKLAAKGRKRAK